MVYVEIKKVKGRHYKYSRVSYRVGGKIKHKSKYIGPVEPVQKRKKSPGRRPTLYVRALTEDEISVLQKERKSSDIFRRDRASILLRSAQGKSVRGICEAIPKDRKTVVVAIKSFNAMGLRAMERKKQKGAEPKITTEQRAAIAQVATTDPMNLGLHFTSWTLRKLQDYIVKEQIVPSISHVRIRTILCTQGIRYRKSKRWQYSNDPDFSKKTSDRLPEKESPTK
jgi:transposase